MYRLLRSPWRGPMYVSSLNKSLASIGRLLRRWVGPWSCALGRPLLWILKNVRILGWWSLVGVWMVSPPRLSRTGQIVVQWRVHLCIAGQHRCPLSRPYSVPRTTGRSGRQYSPWHFEHKILTWVSDTRISVLGGGRLVRSCRRGVSVVIAYCFIRCAPRVLVGW